MPKRKYQVRFSRPVVGEKATPLSGILGELHLAHGAHLLALDLSGERYQVRDLQKVGRVWKGTFGKLRDDAPHLVNSDNEEKELDLDDGDRLLEKCHFLYRELGNLLVWQLNKGRIQIRSATPVDSMNEGGMLRAVDQQLSVHSKR